LVSEKKLIGFFINKFKVQ